MKKLKKKEVLINHILKLNKKIESLFEAIKHGDKEHQDWLENHLKTHFKNIKNTKVEKIIKDAKAKK